MRRIAASVLTVALISTGVYYAGSLISQCAPGIARESGECIGVTDGSFVFDEALEDVEEKIKAENESLQDQQRVATVAMLMPMTAGPTASLSMAQIRAHTEGAYIRQIRNNDESGSVKIRLVLANEGSREQHWKPVVNDLVDMLDDPKPLLAVTGLGLSSQSTVDSARALAQHDIPMVGSVTSASGLNKLGSDLGGPIAGLNRVRPTNHDDLAAVANYIRKTDHKKATLVYDSNLDDFYTNDLARQFKTQFRSYWEAANLTSDRYDGTRGSGIESQFQTIARRLCPVESPDMVMYSGRATLLPTFVQQLRERPCARERLITVLTGSDATDLKVSLPKSRPTDAPVSVIYATVDEEKALENDKNPDKDQYDRFKQIFTAHFSSAELRNGWAIMAHDALLTADTAIQIATGQRAEPASRVNVRGHLGLLNAAEMGESVQGASGTFTIDDETGDRISERIPVIELRTDGTIAVRDVYHPPNAP